MKNSVKILGVFILLGSMGLTSALAADVVQMATSEDLSAFDAQLTGDDAIPAPKKVKAKSGNGLGAIVSAEAKNLRESGLKVNFGQTVRQQAIGHGRGTERSENHNRDQAATAAGKKAKK